jgi:mono/diheme cytochrome c family protein
MIRIRAALVTAVLALVSASAAQAQAAAPKVPPQVTAANVEKGQAIFKSAGLCFACHGPDAQGTAAAPKLIDRQFVHSDGSYDGIVAYLKKGVSKEDSKTGMAMPPRGGSNISDDDVNLVAAYVWSISHGGAKGS